jgi:hypothetical protein
LTCLLINNKSFGSKIDEVFAMSSIRRAIVRNLSAATALVALCSACGAKQPGAEAAYQKGSENCSSAFIADFNRVNTRVGYAATDTDFASADREISNFESKYRDVACVAVRTSTDTEHKVSANSQISEWRGAISSRKVRGGSSSSTGPTYTYPLKPLDAAGEVLVSTLSKGIDLEVLDSTVFNSMMKKEPTHVLENGRSIPLADVSKARPICTFNTLGTSVANKKPGEKIHFGGSNEEDKALMMVSHGDMIVLSCAKPDGEVWNFKVKDIVDALGSVAKLTVTK